MKKGAWLVLFLLPLLVAAQERVDSIRFFQEESIIETTLEFDMRELLSKKKNDHFLPARISMQFDNGQKIDEEIKISVRGNFRKENCFMPGLKLDFHNPGSPLLYQLDKLKMVCGCGTNSDDEQLVLREFLVYKMFNLFTDLSLRVRLMKVNFRDSKGKRKPYTQYAFLIEDIDAMAKRNGMKEVQDTLVYTERTDRDQATLVSMFQYMIGNTDWSVPNYHNVKLVRKKKEPTSAPLIVPYDFDICGIVDPPYATVDHQLPINSVRERLYRGFPRELPELQATITLFNEKQALLLGLVKNYPLLDNRSRRWMSSYIEDFYKVINGGKNLVEAVFIHGARTQ